MNNATGVEETPKKRTKKEKAEPVVDLAEGAEEITHSLQQRFAQARDVIEDVRERADVVMREHPYAVPLAAGAVGVGVGVLLSSKITRYVFMTAAGTLLSEAFAPQLKSIGKQVIASMQDKISELTDGEEMEP